MVSFIKNITFAICCTLATSLISIIAFFCRFSKNGMIKIYKTWGAVILFLAKYIYGITYQVSGIENIKPNAIIASKHQSIWETIIFLTLLDKPSYILKKSLLSIPFYGWHLKQMNMIAVDRKGGIKSMKKMILDIKEKLSLGHNIVIFPQGTRVPYNSSLQDYPYHFSFLSLYQEGFDVIPVTLDSGKYWPPKLFSKKSAGAIQMKIMPVMPKGLNSGDFKKTLIELLEHK